MYDFAYDRLGRITRLHLTRTLGVRPPRATDQHLQCLIRQYVRVHVPQHLKDARAAALRHAGLSFPGQKLLCEH